jgi:ketopantoate reductase
LKHAIVGAGAAGGLIGAARAHEGHQVTVLMRPESLARHLSQLCLECLSGKIEAPIRLDTKLNAFVDMLWNLQIRIRAKMRLLLGFLGS